MYVKITKHLAMIKGFFKKIIVLEVCARVSAVQWFMWEVRGQPSGMGSAMVASGDGIEPSHWLSDRFLNIPDINSSVMDPRCFCWPQSLLDLDSNTGTGALLPSCHLLPQSVQMPDCCVL